jgi:hypothetical protein
VNHWAASNFPSKYKASSKLSIGQFIPLTLSHPMKFSCVPMLLKAYSGIELSNYFIIPIFLESQDISQVFGLTSCNDCIKDWIMLALNVGSINQLRICHRFSLGHDY